MAEMNKAMLSATRLLLSIEGGVQMNGVSALRIKDAVPSTLELDSSVPRLCLLRAFPRFNGSKSDDMSHTTHERDLKVYPRGS